MIDRLLESARFDGNLRQERIELGEPHGADEPRNESLNEHELFTGGEFLNAMHELANGRVVQPLLEGAVSCIDAGVIGW